MENRLKSCDCSDQTGY